MSSASVIDTQILKWLYRQVELGKAASTYLFTGVEKKKKKELALTFAKALNCLEKKPKPDCACVSCRKIDAQNHPDIKWYGLDEDASSIKIDEVRDFKNWLSYKSFEGKAKVFIFNDAERLTPEAQNALLKSLEEPPPGNVILLLIPNRKSLFDTISSRATEIRVPPYRTKEIRDLFTNEGIEGAEAEFVARISRGELSVAREALDEKRFDERREWTEKLFKSPVSFLEEFHSGKRDETKRVFRFLVELAQDLLVLKTGKNEELLIHADIRGKLNLIAEKQSFDAIAALFDAMVEAEKALDDYANQKLTLTHGEILWIEFLKGRQVTV